jgi:hypothetical protein
MRFEIRHQTDTLVVEVDRWWDARTVGLAHFVCEVSDLQFESTTKDVDIECRWIGFDNCGAGTVRQLQFRARNRRKRGSWKDIEEYVESRTA